MRFSEIVEVRMGARELGLKPSRDYTIGVEFEVSVSPVDDRTGVSVGEGGIDPENYNSEYDFRSAIRDDAYSAIMQQYEDVDLYDFLDDQGMSLSDIEELLDLQPKNKNDSSYIGSSGSEYDHDLTKYSSEILVDIFLDSSGEELDEYAVESELYEKYEDDVSYYQQDLIDNSIDNFMNSRRLEISRAWDEGEVFGDSTKSLIYVANKLKGKNFKVQTGTTNYNAWSVVPDATEGVDAEIVSPKMSLNNGIKKIEEIFDLIKDDPNITTNQATGLHINIGTWADNEINKIDWVKFMVLFNSNRVLQDFDRIENKFTPDLLPRLISSLEKDDIKQYNQAVGGLNKEARRIMEKYSSINLSKLQSAGIIEIRAPGNYGYEDKFELLKQHILRAIRALEIAADPSAYRKDYLSRLYKLAPQDQDDSDKLQPLYDFFDTTNERDILSSVFNDVKRLGGIYDQDGSNLISKQNLLLLKQLYAKYPNILEDHINRLSQIEKLKDNKYLKILNSFKVKK